MFIPTTRAEAKKLGWNSLDIIFVSGDTYIDVSNDGVALLAKYLVAHGYKVGIIAQPDIESDTDITRLGEPDLFWGISAGCVDSMVANYTSLNKRRSNDDLTPGGINNRRPDRATIIYTNLIKKYFKSNHPVLLGGVEASLRRIAHYDYWTDTIRRSVLCDSKADALIYGMGEKSILQFAEAIRSGNDFRSIRGLCYMTNAPREDYLQLPSYAEVKADKAKFTEMFNTFYRNNDPISAHGLCQQVDQRYWIQNPPQPYLTEQEIDEIYSLDFERDSPQYYLDMGKINALETVRFSITSHRGCFGECNFCAIAVHQGRHIISRSHQSIINEIKQITKNKHFKGIISDLGGATANMYKMFCEKQEKHGVCVGKSCLFPNLCKNMIPAHNEQIKLLAEARAVPGVKKIFIASGLRFDLIVQDEKTGQRYLEELILHHISGQMKIAPEHIDKNVLQLMRKPDNRHLSDFIKRFRDTTRKFGKKQFLTYYFIAAHPGCTAESTQVLKDFIKQELFINPEQIQIFTPTPSTYSTLQFYTGKNSFTGEDIFVEKKNSNKSKEKAFLQGRDLEKQNYKGSSPDNHAADKSQTKFSKFSSHKTKDDKHFQPYKGKTHGR